MGIRAGLTVISSDDFDDVAVGGEPRIADQVRYSIDKAWYGLHLLFSKKPPPLDCAISGDLLHPLSPHTLDEFCEGNHEYYIGFMSPALVRGISEELDDLNPSLVENCIDKLGVDGCGCDSYFFNQLISAYADAASQNCALMICIA